MNEPNRTTLQRDSDRSGAAIARAPLRAAVIGCGRVGQLHAAALAESSDATLIAVCDPSADRAGPLADRYRATSYAGFGDLLRAERPEVVTVATPDHLHLEPVLAALEAGCHVFCEKPLSTRFAEAETMIAAARKYRRFLGVDFNRRYGFAYRRGVDLLREGRLGTPTSVTVQVTDRFPPLAVRTSPTVLFTTLLTHHFDLVRWLMGPIESLYVTGSLDSQTNLLSDVILALRFQEGGVGTIAATYRPEQTRTHETTTIVGEAGTLILEDVTRSVSFIGSDPDHVETWRSDLPDPQHAFWQTVVSHVQAFAAAVRCGDAPEVTGIDGVESLRIAAAAEHSWKTGLPVEVACGGDW